LILFALMGLIGAKCIAELKRSPEKTAEPDRKDFTASFGETVQR
jgi:hypothetical protein